MNKENGLGLGARIAKVGDKILNIFLGLVIIVAFLYGGYGLWDTYRIYSDAGVNDDILKFKPTGESESNPSLADLAKLNPDTVGWLVVDGTNVDYPIVQGKTNMEYINKSIDGKFSLPGSIFLDNRNKRDFTDYYSLLYGHHMEGEKMFGVLPKFQDKAFFDGHKTGTIYTENKTIKIEIFACVHTDAYDEMMFNPTGIETEKSQQLLLEHIKNKAVQYRETELISSDKIIGLSTCYDVTTNGRIIVVGKISG